jgi:diphosphomevalonate decarboxylase
MTDKPKFDSLSGTVGWQSPSNIAIVKYWGKRPGQLPMNPSLSMTLNEAVTNTSIAFRPRVSGEVTYEFRFFAQHYPQFHPKLDVFFGHLFAKYPFLRYYHFKIDSQNTFPHSAGVASSASSMSALALCGEEIAHQVMGSTTLFSPLEASDLARLSSGSAVRSLHPQWAVWGATSAVVGANDNVAVQLRSVHPVFVDYRDAVLLVDEGTKKVSSSAGHQLMDTHPYQKGRLDQAHFNMERLVKAMREGDLSVFVDVCEEEALSLHALMMSSRPGYLLMHPNSIKIIELVRDFREKTSIPVAFTLDAGPNVHLLYPSMHLVEVEKWINEQLLPYTANGKPFINSIGNGPKPMDI